MFGGIGQLGRMVIWICMYGWLEGSITNRGVNSASSNMPPGRISQVDTLVESWCL